jgi:hypothetical protein
MKNRSYFVLDNTLRLLYRTLSIRGGTLMAIRFIHRGRRYEADTPEEAVKLREHLEAEDRKDVEMGVALDEELVYEKTKWTEDRFVDLVEHIGVIQKRFLAVLLETRGGVHVDYAAKRLGLSSSMALAGVQSGLAKQVRALGLEPGDLYRVQITWTEGERNRYLTLDEGFRLAALDNDWPPKHIKKELKEVKK